ncbi:hypothetical protein [Spiroplasma endosymbiont of Aspidapion aeneum]|uniref:hypothetical protein n=1 Tax=Spiroplasma endosymbiont of Aspidapion aeneum TaxID=3066276 RepID=UPI00313D10CB
MEEKQIQENAETEQQSQKKDNLSQNEKNSINIERKFTQQELDEIIRKRITKSQAEIIELKDYKISNEISNILSNAGLQHNNNQIDLIKKLDIDVSNSKNVIETYKNLFSIKNDILEKIDIKENKVNKAKFNPADPAGLLGKE